MFKKAYTYQDVALVPAYSNIDSRLDPKVDSWLTSSIKISIPIINAPMDTVISKELSTLLLNRGGIPIFNRLTSLDKYKQLFENFGDKVVVSTCVNDIDEIQQVIDLGFTKILLDTANGWTRRMLNCINAVKNYNGSLNVLAGNVCTTQGTLDLINAGADAVRVGIGPGGACTTRLVTGVGMPQFSAVYECAQEAKRFRIPIIADGGIESSREMCLALAAGATTVMVGKQFALTYESGAEKKYAPGSHHCGGHKAEPTEAKFRGQASEDFQKDHYGKVKEGTIAEGIAFWAPTTGSANKLLDDLLAGLRSSMTYLGAKSIKEYQQKATFVEVTNTYMTESKPRPN